MQVRAPRGSCAVQGGAAGDKTSAPGSLDPACRCAIPGAAQGGVDLDKTSAPGSLDPGDGNPCIACEAVADCVGGTIVSASGGAWMTTQVPASRNMNSDLPVRIDDLQSLIFGMALNANVLLLI